MVIVIMTYSNYINSWEIVFLNIDGMYLFGPIKENGEALREKCGSMRIFVLFFCNKKVEWPPHVRNEASSL